MSFHNIKEAFRSRKTSAEIQETADAIDKLVDDGKLNLPSNGYSEAEAGEKSKPVSGNVSLRNIAEGILGEEGVDAISRMHEGDSLQRWRAREAVNPVRLSAFSTITGNLIQKAADLGYQAPEFIGDSLVTETSATSDNEREVDIADIEDDALEVKEGEEYPSTKFGEDYIDVPQSVKRGLRIALTREMVFFDQTGKLGQLATRMGYRLRLNKERRVLQVVLGLVNTYKRRGVARNTYVASSDPRINDLASNALTDWTTIDKTMQKIADYTDDRTVGEPVVVTPREMIVMPQRLATARRIINATEIRVGDGASNSIQTVSGNPIGGLGMSLVSSYWLYWMLTQPTARGGGGLAGSTAADYWFLGDMKRAFGYRTLFPYAVRQAANHDDEFDRDVVAQWRCDERGVAYVRSPWHAFRNKP